MALAHYIGRGWTAGSLAVAAALFAVASGTAQANRKVLRVSLNTQAAFHHNVSYVLGEQLSLPAADRSDRHSRVPFDFPVFWNVVRQ
jgi:hypothetical protein